MYFFPCRYKICIYIKLKNVNFILIFEQFEFQIVTCYYITSIILRLNKYLFPIIFI